MTNLYTFLWDKFSQYYHENDSNKDQDPNNEGRGTLERFLNVIGIEVTDESIGPLENFINEIDPYTADDQFLTQIAWAVGNPADILNNVDIYRTILSQIISIYQIKGTKRSYELLFGLLGLQVVLTEFFPADNLYDDGLIYDDDSEDATTYDFSGCELTCTDYSLVYSNLPGKSVAPLTEQQIADLTSLITDLIQPLGAVLRDLTYDPSGDGGGGTVDSAPISITNNSNFLTTLQYGFFDIDNNLTSTGVIGLGAIFEGAMDRADNYKFALFLPYADIGFDLLNINSNVGGAIIATAEEATQGLLPNGSNGINGITKVVTPLITGISYVTLDDLINAETDNLEVTFGDVTALMNMINQSSYPWEILEVDDTDALIALHTILTGNTLNVTTIRPNTFDQRNPTANGTILADIYITFDRGLTYQKYTQIFFTWMAGQVLLHASNYILITDHDVLPTGVTVGPDY